MKSFLVPLLLAVVAHAQGPPPHQRHGPPAERWWRDPDLIQKLNITPDQQKRIDDIYQESRSHLIDLFSAVQKEESVMQPLLDAEHPEEAKILTQIDRVAQARAELEKANARMLLRFRTVLSQDQWHRLQSEPPHPPGRDRHP